MSAKTISIFLPDGNPNGIKKLEVSNRIIRAYEIPRIKLATAKQYAELFQPALYLLFDKEGTRAYVGESENFYERVKNHDQSKDFWEVVVCFVATNKSLEKSDVKYLEYLAVTEAKVANRIETENKTVPLENNLHEFKVPTIKEFFQDVKLLTSTLGYPLFDVVKTSHINEESLWFCRGRNTNARGVYTENGFTVLAGSIIDITTTPSLIKGFPKEAAERSGKLRDNSKRYSETACELINDLTFKSVSRAGGFCLGQPSNGWLDWRDADGRTMDEVMRKQIEN